MLPIVFIADRPWVLAIPSAAAIASVISMAPLSTALAYILFFHLLATAGAVNASLVTLLIPATAILLEVGVLGESLTKEHMAGLALIVLGLLVIDGRIGQKRSY